MSNQRVNELPIIDLTTETLKPGSSSWSGACKDVQKAFEEYGCFIAIHDKFSSDPTTQFFKSLQDLFNLPLETKMQNTSFDPFFGYLGPMPTMPLYESFGFMGAQDMDEIQSFSNQLWPSGNKKFCEILHFFSKKLSELEHLVSRMVFESYGVEKHLDSHLRSQTYLMRFTKYRVPQENEINIGLTPHSDKNFMSILLENEVSGLEIKTKQGNWVAVDLPPSSLLFLAGDSLKKLSELEHLVSRMLFESYGVEKHLDSHLGSLTYLTRFTKYRVPRENEINIGLTPHSDKNFMSILHENEVSGLEIKTKQGNWVAVDLPPSSLLFLAGDSLKAWSNGKIHPVVHTVKMCGKEERYSLGQFAYPKAGKLVDTLEEFIDEDHPRLYKPFDIYEYLKFCRLPKWSLEALDDDILQAYCGL